MALSDHLAGSGLKGAGSIGLRASAMIVLIQRAARCLDAATHQVPLPTPAPAPAREYFKNLLRFGRMGLTCRIVRARQETDCLNRSTRLRQTSARQAKFATKFPTKAP